MKTNPRINPIERATSRTWADWLAFLDRAGAKDLDHPAIAATVHAELTGKVDNPGWWAQSVTVAYEQEIGRRIPGQRQDGTFEASLSRATPLTMQALMDRWAAFAAQDPAVLALIAGAPRVGGTEKRLTWRTKAHDGSTITVTSQPKAGGTASIVVQLLGLQNYEMHEDARAKWVSILERFLKG